MNKFYEKATFAGGCFWCIQELFDKLDGVINTRAGYTGGKKENPSYQDVSTGKTSHVEAVEITFNPAVISYERLLEIFWQNIDPTLTNQQFADKGTQYRTAIFYYNECQKKIAEKSKKELEESGKFNKPVATEIVPVSEFYPAEEYHQCYYKKNPLKYNFYKKGSGRINSLKQIWPEKYDK